MESWKKNRVRLGWQTDPIFMVLDILRKVRGSLASARKMDPMKRALHERLSNMQKRRKNRPPRLSYAKGNAGGLRANPQIARPITTNGLYEKYLSQDKKCCLTGRELTTENIAIDHRIPISKGGTDTLDNIDLITKEVNFAKGTLPLADFIQLCKDVAKHNS